MVFSHSSSRSEDNLSPKVTTKDVRSSLRPPTFGGNFLVVSAPTRSHPHPATNTGKKSSRADELTSRGRVFTSGNLVPIARNMNVPSLKSIARNTNVSQLNKDVSPSRKVSRAKSAQASLVRGHYQNVREQTHYNFAAEEDKKTRSLLSSAPCSKPQGKPFSTRLSHLDSSDQQLPQDCILVHETGSNLKTQAQSFNMFVSNREMPCPVYLHSCPDVVSRPGLIRYKTSPVLLETNNCKSSSRGLKLSSTRPARRPAGSSSRPKIYGRSPRSKSSEAVRNSTRGRWLNSWALAGGHQAVSSTAEEDLAIMRDSVRRSPTHSTRRLASADDRCTKDQHRLLPGQMEFSSSYPFHTFSQPLWVSSEAEDDDKTISDKARGGRDEDENSTLKASDGRDHDENSPLKARRGRDHDENITDKAGGGRDHDENSTLKARDGVDSCRTRRVIDTEDSSCTPANTLGAWSPVSLDCSQRTSLDCVWDSLSHDVPQLKDASSAGTICLSHEHILSHINYGSCCRKERILTFCKEPNKEPMKSYRCKELIQSYCSKETIESCCSKEPIKTYRCKEPIQSRYSNERIKTGRNIKPIKCCCSKETIQSHCSKEPIQSCCSKDPIQSCCSKQSIKSYSKELIQSFCCEELMQSFCNKEPFNSFCSKEPMHSFCSKEPMHSFCIKEPMHSFCIKEPMHSFCIKEPMHSFCSKEPIHSFCGKDTIKSCRSIELIPACGSRESIPSCSSDEPIQPYCSEAPIQSCFNENPSETTRPVQLPPPEQASFSQSKDLCVLKRRSSSANTSYISCPKKPVANLIGNLACSSLSPPLLATSSQRENSLMEWPLRSVCARRSVSLPNLSVNPRDSPSLAASQDLSLVLSPQEKLLLAHVLTKLSRLSELCCARNDAHTTASVGTFNIYPSSSSRTTDLASPSSSNNTVVWQRRKLYLLLVLVLTLCGYLAYIMTVSYFYHQQLSS